MLGDLELNRPPRLLLHDGRSVADGAADAYIADTQRLVRLEFVRCLLAGDTEVVCPHHDAGHAILDHRHGDIVDGVDYVSGRQKRDRDDPQATIDHLAAQVDAASLFDEDEII